MSFRRLAAVLLGLITLGPGCGASEAAGGTGTGGASATTGGGGAAPAVSGGAPIGGVGTGGTTGGTATGGASTGGASTGGASTGGASTGGAVTGGTASGGASGGMPATGGAQGGGGSNGGATAGGVGVGGATGGAAMGGQAGSDDGLFIAPDGSDSGDGTRDTPFLTLSRAHEDATPGTTIWVLPGTYDYGTTMSLSKNGSEATPINVWAVDGERPVFDFSRQSRGSNSRGILIQGDYWHLRGLEVENAGDNGINISGSHNVVEDVVLHDNEDTGLQITVSSSLAGNDEYGADNLILNCDSYQNFDPATGGENADGFAAKLRIGPGNVFRGCRAWNNADDGWDLFASNDVVVIEDCWAFANGKVNGQNPAGDGNGFKLGGAPNGTDQGGAVHQVSHNAAFENLTCGFTRNNNPQTPALSDCAVRANPTGDFCALSCSPQSSVSTTAAEAAEIPRNPDGSLPEIQ